MLYRHKSVYYFYFINCTRSQNFLNRISYLKWKFLKGRVHLEVLGVGEKVKSSLSSYSLQGFRPRDLFWSH
jgi:hypothetical protein